MTAVVLWSVRPEVEAASVDHTPATTLAGATSSTLQSLTRVPAWVGNLLITAGGWLSRPIKDDPPLVPAALRRAAEFLVRFAPADLPQPYMAPLRDGGLQLEWDRGDVHLEFEFAADGVDGCLYEGNGDTWEALLETVPDKLLAALDTLAGPA